MLYHSTDRFCRRGAPMENLAHSASFDADDKDAPSEPRIKNLRLLINPKSTESQQTQSLTPLTRGRSPAWPFEALDESNRLRKAGFDSFCSSWDVSIGTTFS